MGIFEVWVTESENFEVTIHDLNGLNHLYRAKKRNKWVKIERVG